MHRVQGCQEKYVLPYNISNIGLYMGYQTDYVTTHDYQLTDSAKLLRALKVHDHLRPITCMRKWLSSIRLFSTMASNAEYSILLNVDNEDDDRIESKPQVSRMRTRLVSDRPLIWIILTFVQTCIIVILSVTIYVQTTNTVSKSTQPRLYYCE